MKILIITAGRYPVPAVKGGAVATLIEHLVKGNSKNSCCDMEVTSPYDACAVSEAKNYKNCRFRFIKTPLFLRMLDNCIYKVATVVFPKRNLISLKSLFTFLWFVWRNAGILRRENYDCVIIENTARLFWCMKLFGNYKKYDGKVYYHLHNEPKKMGGCRENVLQCKKILCISEYIAQSIVSEKSALRFQDTSRISVLRNCVDTEHFKPYNRNKIMSYRNELGFAESDRVIVFSGRIDREKGIREVLLAIKHVQTPNVKLLVVGSSFYGMKVRSPFEEEILQMIDELGDKVKFTGFLPHCKMPLVYNSSEIAVLPSMWEEPAGLTIIEAMACAIPVITTNSGGIPEYIDNESAVMLERDEKIVYSIAEKIDMLLSDRGLAKTMGANGRVRVQKQFNSAEYIKKFVTVL